MDCLVAYLNSSSQGIENVKVHGYVATLILVLRLSGFWGSD